MQKTIRFDLKQSLNIMLEKGVIPSNVSYNSLKKYERNIPMDTEGFVSKDALERHCKKVRFMRFGRIH